MRENWLLTEREVQRLLTLRRSVAAHYYDEGASPTPACRIRWSDASTRSGTSRGARCLDLSVIAGEARATWLVAAHPVMKLCNRLSHGMTLTHDFVALLCPH